MKREDQLETLVNAASKVMTIGDIIKLAIKCSVGIQEKD